MKRLNRLLTGLAAASAATVTLGLAATGVSVASPASTLSASAGAGRLDHGAFPNSRPLPYRVFAPYYEMYDSSTDLATLSQQSGSKFVSLAFLQTATAGSCTAYWD